MLFPKGPALTGQPTNEENIEDVMIACNCTRDRAMQLLKLSNGDPEKAKNHHRTLLNYTNRPKSRPLQPLAANIPTTGNKKSQPGNGTDSVTNLNSSHGQSVHTPPTDEDASPSPESNATVFSGLDTPTVQASLGREGETLPYILPSRPRPRARVSAYPNLTSTPPRSGFHVNRTFPTSESESSPFADPETLPHHEANEESSDGKGDDNGERETREIEWDFVLPFVPPPPSLIPGMVDGPNDFDLSDLVGAMQHGASLELIQRYLAYYEKGTVTKHINKSVKGFPIIFFAVATNNEGIMRTFVTYGADVTAVHEASGVPLIVFTIMHSETILQDTTQIMATLLSLGATPVVIPSAFYAPFNRDLPDNGLGEESLHDINDENKRWCTVAAKAKLARTMNITHRYYLDRAAKTKRPSVRHRQIAKLRNAEALLGVPYFLIGQTAAANLLLKKILSYIMVPSKRPLVLVFAGPSGHGKTELARRLGHLLSLALEVVDCTIFTRETELFGPRAPYVGSERGSPLNNFLAKHDGERCIVFLDEFDKTTPEVHQTLLLPFDNGEYQDRRHLTKINCSKTIWILATNALDPTIKMFCAQNEEAIFLSEDESKKMQLMKQLSKSLKEDFLRRFDSPLTGRISAFLPFLPFSPGEQAVVVHKYLLELSQKVRTSINLTAGQNEQLLGNVRLRVRRDASVCRVVAEQEYHPDLGARSLLTAVKNLVEDVLVETYLDVERSIVETEEMMEFVVDVNGGEVVVNMLTEGRAS